MDIEASAYNSMVSINIPEIVLWQDLAELFAVRLCWLLKQTLTASQ